MPRPEDTQETGTADRDRRRLRGFLNHLIVYFAAMIVLVPVNFVLAPDRPWFVLPLVVWGAPLALHAAYVMGLFGGLFGGPSGAAGRRRR
jgi:uncharacterized membrane protein YedE/YeeE